MEIGSDFTCRGQYGDTKLKIFLPKYQHTQRKVLNFEFWNNGELSKSAKIWFSKSKWYPFLMAWQGVYWQNTTTNVWSVNDGLCVWKLAGNLRKLAAEVFKSFISIYSFFENFSINIKIWKSARNCRNWFSEVSRVFGINLHDRPLDMLIFGQKICLILYSWIGNLTIYITICVSISSIFYACLKQLNFFFDFNGSWNLKRNKR